MNSLIGQRKPPETQGSAACERASICLGALCFIPLP